MECAVSILFRKERLEMGYLRGRLILTTTQQING